MPTDRTVTAKADEPGGKEFTVSQMLDRKWSILATELDKCDLLCFNCHMEEHCGLDQAARVTLGAPKRHGCMPHAETGGFDGEAEPQAV